MDTLDEYDYWWRIFSGINTRGEEPLRVLLGDELGSQLLAKGRKVYVEGRLQTRKWTGQDGAERITTEIVISDMIILDSKYTSQETGDFDIPDDSAIDSDSTSAPKSVSSDNSKKPVSKKGKTSDKKSQDKVKEEEEDEDIPF